MQHAFISMDTYEQILSFLNDNLVVTISHEFSVVVQRIQLMILVMKAMLFSFTSRLIIINKKIKTVVHLVCSTVEALNQKT